MWPFGKKQPRLPAPPEPSCVRCRRAFTEFPDGSLWSSESNDPGLCVGCATRKEERRKRQEELAALVAGRLAGQMRGYRGELPEPKLVAGEAMRLAAAIIDSPEE